MKRLLLFLRNRLKRKKRPHCKHPKVKINGLGDIYCTKCGRDLTE